MVNQDGVMSLGTKYTQMGPPTNFKMFMLHNYLMCYVDNDYRLNFLIQRDMLHTIDVSTVRLWFAIFLFVLFLPRRSLRSLPCSFPRQHFYFFFIFFVNFVSLTFFFFGISRNFFFFEIFLLCHIFFSLLQLPPEVAHAVKYGVRPMNIHHDPHSPFIQQAST